MEEIWKDIQGYEGKYQVSNYGNVKSLNFNRKNKEQPLKPQLLTKGYLGVRLYKNGIGETLKIHRLVAQAFIPNPKQYPEVNHKDENKQNNFVWINEDGSVDLEKSNLEWCSTYYNCNYGTRNNRVAIINGTGSKIVLQFDSNGNLIKEFPSIGEVIRYYGYSRSSISKCCNGKCKQAYGYIWKFKGTA